MLRLKSGFGGGRISKRFSATDTVGAQIKATFFNYVPISAHFWADNF